MKTIGLLLFMIILIITLSNIAAIVNKSNGIPDVFSHFYPERFVDKEQEEALKTMKAPFAAAENAARPVQLDPEITYDPLGGSVVISETLSIPHRHEAAIAEWATEALSEIMTFSITGYQAHKQQLTTLMSPSAINELQSFMDTSNVLSLMQAKNYELRSFVSDVPTLLTSDSIGGRYRWVYDVPISMTFLPIGKANYEKLKEDEYRLEELTFRIQLGRVAQGGLEGVIIETWEPLKKKKESDANE